MKKLVGSLAALVVGSTTMALAPAASTVVNAGKTSCSAMNLKVISTTMSWDEARAYADAMTDDGQTTWRLVEITSRGENSCVVSAVNAAGLPYAWIGLNDYASEGTYSWTSGSPLGAYAPWARNEPTGIVDENCVIIQGRSWRDAYCGAGIPLVVQWV